MDSYCLSPEEREAMKQEFFTSLHCALPGTIVSFDPAAQTAEIRPVVKAGSLACFVLLLSIPAAIDLLGEYQWKRSGSQI